MSAAPAQPEAVSPPTARPLRADAVRNRERVIQAARVVFAEQGVSAQVEDIARRAGVGVGTVYRHFPTKEALVDAAMTARFAEALALARAALEIEDPWDAVREAFQRTAELQARDRCFCGAVGEWVDSDAARPVMDQLREVWSRLFERAQAAGAMRQDVSADDMHPMMCGLASVVVSSRDAREWQRYLTILTDGLRAGQIDPSRPRATAGRSRTA